MFPEQSLRIWIDATAAPVCIIAPISSWAAAVTGFVEGEDGFSIFIRAIPYNFYAILTIVMMIAMVMMKVEYGPMKLHEDNAKKGDIYTTPDRPYANAEEEAVDNCKGKVMDLFDPDHFTDHLLCDRNDLHRWVLLTESVL